MTHKVHTSWPGLVLDVSEEEYMFYDLLVKLHTHSLINDMMFLTAEREMILKGYVTVA